MKSIIYHHQDIFDSTHNVILHGCNSQFKMNSGIAKIIRKKFPEAYNVYMESHGTLGTISVCEKTTPRIINGITQEYYGQQPKCYVNYRAMQTVFELSDQYCEQHGYHHIAMPRIGAGLGGGDWNIISKLIETSFQHAQPHVYVI